MLMKSHDSLLNLFDTIKGEIKNTPLCIYDNNWKSTVEIHLPPSSKAFGSIQFCGGDKKAPYLELRFKRVHLRAAEVFEVINQIDEKLFRNDVVHNDATEPEAIRFHFYEDTDVARELIKEIFNTLDKGLVK